MDTTPATTPTELDPANPSTTGAFSLTERAMQQVRTVIKAQGFEGYVLSVRVVPSGCSGFAYDLNLVKESKPGDQLWVQDEIQVATDALSVQYLGGTQVDYVVGDHSAGFKFENPNAKSSCGCGSSFST